MITNPIQTQRALLTWQRPLGHGGRRDRIAVAELRQDDRGVRFEYLSEGVSDAKEQGFSGYPGLPLEQASPSYDAIRVLLRRLPPRERPDFQEFLAAFGLSPEAKLSDLSLLAYTGARVASDSDGFGIAESFDAFAPPFQYIFDVSGYRHYRSEALGLAPDEPISFRPEPTNEFDARAIEVMRLDGTRLGYINRTQAAVIGDWLLSESVHASVFRLNGRAAYPRLFVLANILPKAATVLPDG